MKAAPALVIISASLFAQEPAVENAKVETRAFSGSLNAQLTQFGAGPFWAAYSEPAIPGRQTNMCEGGAAVLRLEGQTAVVILIRIANSQVDKLRISSPDCRIDAGGLPFHWITGVPASESIAWLKGRATSSPDPALMAIAMHRGAAAEEALDQFTAPDQPDRLRGKAAFWLGNSRETHGFETLKRMLASDPSEKVREQVIFALTQREEPAAMNTVMNAARNDGDPRIRNHALFWIAQKAAGEQALDAVGNAIANDPDYTVKEKALFALSLIPGGEGVPLLIAVAKANADPAIRRKAMFWLGQSKDPKAIDFFAQVLASR